MTKTQFKDKIIESNCIENVKNDSIVKLQKLNKNIL